MYVHNFNNQNKVIQLFNNNSQLRRRPSERHSGLSNQCLMILLSVLSEFPVCVTVFAFLSLL